MKNEKSSFNCEWLFFTALTTLNTFDYVFHFSLSLKTDLRISIKTLTFARDF